MLRITVVARGGFEEYIRREMESKGLSAGNVCLNLAITGMEYKESLRGIPALAADALKEQQVKETKGHEKIQSGRTRSMA